MTPPRSKERGVRDQMKEAKRAEYSSKMNAVQNKGRQQEEPKAKTKTNEKDEFCTSQIDAFETGLPQAVTERRRRDRGREEGGDDEDEQQQTFYSFGSTPSSAQLHTQNITASSTFASPPFSPLPHTQLSSPSVLVGTSPGPLNHSSQPHTPLLSHKSPSAHPAQSLPLPLFVLLFPPSRCSSLVGYLERTYNAMRMYL